MHTHVKICIINEQARIEYSAISFPQPRRNRDESQTVINRRTKTRVSLSLERKKRRRDARIINVINVGQQRGACDLSDLCLKSVNRFSTEISFVRS